MTDLLYFIELVNVFILSFLTYIMINQYKLTRVPEFLIMGLSFFAATSSYLIDIFYDLIYYQSYDESIPIARYLTVQKIMILLHISVFSLFFIIGYRTQWPRGNKFHLFLFVFSSLFLIMLTLNLEFAEIPKKSIIIGIPISSTISSGFGGIIEVLPQFYYGQGHPFLFVVYRIYCVTILIYAYINLKNHLHYPKFNQARLSWISAFTIYSLSEVVFLVSILLSSPLSATIERFLVLFSVFVLLYLGIFVPEGILLPKAQIMNLMKVYESMEDIEKPRGQSIFMDKTIEYINFIGQAMAGLENKLD